jgi:hypothetical protein
MIGIALKVRRAGRRSGDEHVIRDANGACVAVFVLERIAG